jgi:nitroreductase
MKVYDAMITRRSVRRFTDEPVSDEKVKMLLETARLAPTGGNRQPWEFIAIRNPRRVTGIKMFSEGLGGTPTLIIAAITPDRRPITLLDIGMATENIMIQCIEFGLGSCAIASFNEVPIKNLLEIPEEKELVLLLAIGYPDGEPRLRPKKELEEIAFDEVYGRKLEL